ncbi:hypothetical protein [Rhodopirellula sp. MGV]|uniref:hypothetical protein n=1 Tax=Rhodopirellula sp. MGV TaxID=2023130 RepID=UPI00117B5F34|nr:hypothetical protein [Rhodopirellula sp. MGV]
MSQEIAQDGGCARGWADKTIGKRLNLCEAKRQVVDAMIDLLDCNHKSNALGTQNEGRQPNPRVDFSKEVSCLRGEGEGYCASTDRFNEPLILKS